MLEGKELEGGIGKDGAFGQYGLDVKDDGNIAADLVLKVDRAFLSDYVTVKGSGSLVVNVDLLGGVKRVLAKNSSTILMTLGSKLTGIFRKAKPAADVAVNEQPLPGAVPVQETVV